LTHVKGLPLADENPETPSASDEIAQFWHATAFDHGRRQQLLARALAAGRPAGMRSWAHDDKQDAKITDADGPH
jgi:hypothetical protein